MGSSSSFGNTRRIVDKFCLVNANTTIIELNYYSFSYYDYESLEACQWRFESQLAVSVLVKNELNKLLKCVNNKGY